MSNESQISRRSFIKSGVTGAASLAAAGGVAFLTKPE